MNEGFKESSAAYGRPEFAGKGNGSLFIVLPHTVVRVVYSDETGTGSTEKEPFTVVTAIMINMDSQWANVSNDIADIRPFKREFKGQRLYRDLRSGRHRPDADAILRQMLAIPKKRHLPLFYGAVDRARFKELRPNVMNWLPAAERKVPPNLASEVVSAFDHCMGKIDTYVHTLLPGENVLWIADKSQYDELLRNGRTWFDSLKIIDWNAVGIPAVSDTEIEPHRAHIVDTIFFGASHDSRALQLADVCCSTINLHLRNVEYAESYYQLIRSQIVNEDPPAPI